MRKAMCWMLALCVMGFAAPALAAAPVIGLCIYNMDTFVTSLVDVIMGMAEGKADMRVFNALNNQNQQNRQVEELLDQGVDALIVNPVDRTAALYQLRMALKYQTPIVFINREPLPEDLAQYDLAYYVGIDPKEQGYLGGTLAADCFLSDPQTDLNGDGVMQTVLFKGEPGHQDAELRTQYALKALQEAGVEVELLSVEVALWERTLGQERMAALLGVFGDRVECVIANNDDMALGAIDALKAAGYFSGVKSIPVIGNDATAAALDALEQGSLHATVYNNARLQGDAALTLAMLLARGEPVDQTTFSYPMHDKVVYVDSVCITLDNIDEAQ